MWSFVGGVFLGALCSWAITHIYYVHASNAQAETINELSRRLKVLQEEMATRVRKMLLDEAREGPQLFSIEPVEPGFLDSPKWISKKFRILLWCEHSLLPIQALNGENDGRGVYELNLSRDWLAKAAPFLKVLASTFNAASPVGSFADSLGLDDETRRTIDDQLRLEQQSRCTESKDGDLFNPRLDRTDAAELESGGPIRAKGTLLRQLHAWLKEQDPSFGGLVRVQDKRGEFLWVHPQYEKEY